MGPRLESSLSPDAWKHIVYGKGSWIMHMLRRRMGDEKFLAMLAELRQPLRSGSRSPPTNSGQLAADFLPPKSPDPKLEAFFDQWVYGTGIPQLKMTWSLKGKAPALRVIGHGDAIRGQRTISACRFRSRYNSRRGSSDPLGAKRGRAGDFHRGRPPGAVEGAARPGTERSEEIGGGCDDPEHSRRDAHGSLAGFAASV